MVKCVDRNASRWYSAKRMERVLQHTDGVPAAVTLAAPGTASGISGRDSEVAEHVVQFYEADAFLLDAVKDFIGASLRAGGAGIVIATQEHRAGLEQRLAADGLDLAAARASGRYVALDADEVLPRIVIDGVPDPARFDEVVGSIIARVAAGHRVRVFGELVTLLTAEGKHTAAIRLEKIWNALQQRLSFSLFCAYPIEQLSGEALTPILDDVCAQHGYVIPAESYTALPTEMDRLRAVAALQQRAGSLEAALAAQWSAREAAEDALRLRDDFVSIAAHELRTPITSLSGQAQLLLRRLRRDGIVDPEQLTPALESIKGQADKLARLINRLLDSSRLETGKLALERQPMNLVELVAQVVAGAGAWSDQHIITLESPPILEVWADPLRLEQVVINLLDNAVKYSLRGGPVEVVLAQTGPDTAELAVRDYGLGIPAEKRAHLFERFYQAHADGHRGGMGLGLHISHQIVELHGGAIRAESPPNGGTRFVVELPIGLDHLAAP